MSLIRTGRLDLSPWTFGDKHALVSAELAHLEDRDLDAMQLYEKAIRAARENGFVQNEGIANELAAKFYLARGYETSAHAYLRNARYCYLRWGALGKVRQLDQRYPHLHEERVPAFSTATIGTSVEQLDLGTVMKANEIAKFGLAEARRSILSLRSGAVQESELIATLQRLVEYSNVAGLLRCDFRSDSLLEERLPPRIQHELLRFAQEAISNAVRHAKPTVVSVALRWEPPDLVLQVKDNGSGISSASLEKSEGFGLSNMRTRASQIDGKLDIHTAAGHGTSIILTVPIPS